VNTTKNKDHLQKVKYSFMKILTGSDFSVAFPGAPVMAFGVF
jgi:hypothetical protein